MIKRYESFEPNEEWEENEPSKMIMMKEIYTPELDYLIEKDLGVVWYDLDIKGYLNNFPIKIELLEKYLEDIKKMGRDYVDIDFHEDHRAYIIQGVKIE